jgi:hypothetical protein
MAGLPDGTYIIVNGGQHGAAGFGLGGDPNYNVSNDSSIGTDQSLFWQLLKYLRPSFMTPRSL